MFDFLYIFVGITVCLYNGKCT